MMERQRLVTLIGILAALLMLAGCRRAPIPASPTPVPPTPAPPTLTPTTTVIPETEIADNDEEILWCDEEIEVWVTAFYDADENGLFDNDDRAMSGINFNFVDAQDNLTTSSSLMVNPSNEDGYAGFSDFRSCSSYSLSIYPDVPPGYRLTTKARLSGVTDLYNTEPLYDFGFAGPAPEVYRTSLTSNQIPTCTLHSEFALAQEAEGFTLAAAPDGSIWLGNVEAGSGIGVAHSDPQRQTWTTYSASDGLPNSVIHTIQIAPNGDVWVAHDEGAAVFDGAVWTTYDVFHLQDDNYVTDIGFAPDGRIWFTGVDGAASLNPQSGQWHLYRFTPDAQKSIPFYAVLASNDGTIWFGTQRWGIVQLLFPTGDVNQPSWTVWDEAFHLDDPFYEDVHVPLTTVPQIVEVADGTLWLLDIYATVALSSDRNFTYTLDPPIEGTDPWMERAPDGSLWFSTSWGILHALPPTSAEWWQTATETFYAWSVIGLPESPGGPIAFASDRIIWLTTDAGPAECIFP